MANFRQRDPAASLVAFQAALLAAGDEPTLVRDALAHILTAVDAEVGVLVRDGAVADAAAAPDGLLSADDLLAVGHDAAEPVLTTLRHHAVAAVPLHQARDDRLVVARRATPLSADEIGLLEHMAALLAFALRARSTAARADALQARDAAQAVEIAQLTPLRSAFEGSEAGVALVDAAGRIGRANRALCELLGRSEAQLSGTPLALVLGLSDPAQGPIVDVLEARTPTAQVELSVTMPGGEQRWVDLTLSALCDEETGAVDQALVAVADITSRKRAEIALRESEERFRTAFEESNIGMAILARDGMTMRINAAFEQEILGYEPDELVGRSILDVAHADDRAADLQAGARLSAGEVETMEHERRFRHRNGYWVWCLISISAVREDGRVRQFVAQAQDITQRRAIEQFLRESESRYRSLVEHLPLVTCRDRLDDDSSNLYSSPQIEDLLGHPVQDWIDDPSMLRRVIHPDDRVRVMTEIRRCNATLEDVSCEFRTVAADGRSAVVFKEGVVVRDESGAPLYRQGYLLDVTERRHLEEQLRLAQKLESVGSMAAGIAHEINTPIQFVSDSVAFVGESLKDLFALGRTAHDILGAIPGPDGETARAQLAAADEEADLDYLLERLPKACERMADGVERVASIVRAMKAFAHPSAGPHGAVDVNELVRTTLVVARAEYKYVADVVLELDEEVPLISADAGELNQVLLNLMVNAGHAIADAQIDDQPRGTISISTSYTDDEVLVSIRDTGCGIPPSVRDRIFDPFYTTKEVGRGTGQGLAIARTIVVDHHQGRIDVASAPGEGTTMLVALPRATPASEAAIAA